MKRTDGIFQGSILSMIALGLGTGSLLRFRFHISEETKLLIEMAGDVLLNLLQMFAVPLIVTSVIAGVTALNTRLSGKTAVYILLYVCGTTTLAVVLGLFLVLTFEPGAESAVRYAESHVPEYSMHLVFMDIFRNMIPESFIQAFFEHYQTVVTEINPKDNTIIINPLKGFNDTAKQLMGRYVAGANMLGLITWSFVIGILLNRVGVRAKITVKAAREMNDAIKIIFKYILWYMPVGIFFLMTCHVLEIEDWNAVIKLGKLLLVLFLGFGIHSLIVLPLVYVVFTKQNPFMVFRHSYRALLNAVIMASSSATLPITLQCCEEKMKVDVRFCRLTLPIVSTINMNGMAIYEVIAAVFIAELSHINLDIGHIFSIGLTSAVASFGAAGVPMLGPASTVLILTAVGLPARDVSILMAFEWFIDHFATMVNVLGDCFGMGVISHLCRNELKNLADGMGNHPIHQVKLDLCLDLNDQFISSTASSSSPPRSISPK
ncbi:PREDICTED: excitatory amino acid transporter 3-like [Poecilia mexicana]|uniref:excitatory amino acid transporter 3-like n=1 Tax=Poecilia mexicana TaxID=48701 RepID=UPI00072DF1F0|nr:PREDICTED: excitatory amino acid transporter 3-like [Poecilia mexicana]